MNETFRAGDILRQRPLSLSFFRSLQLPLLLSLNWYRKEVSERTGFQNQ